MAKLQAKVQWFVFSGHSVVLQQSVTCAVVWLPGAGCSDLRGAGLGEGTLSPEPEDCSAPATAKQVTSCNHAKTTTN